MKWLLAILLFVSLSAHAESLCAGYMQADSSSGLIAYLEVLLDMNEMTIGDLRVFSDSLRAGKTQNPLSGGGSISARIHARAIDEYLQSGQVNERELLAWATEALTKSEGERHVRSAATKETAFASWPMRFLPVSLVPIRMFTSPRTVAVMDSLVTEKMWADVMGGEKSARPNLPVVNISWIQAARFANRLSVRDGLPEIYDLRAIDAWEASPQKKSPYPPGPAISAPYGDVAQTEGYRMPTDEEAKFLLSHAHMNGESPAKFAWSQENSDLELQPVAKLRPVLIDGNEFYDVLGNVSIFVDINPDIAWERGIGEAFCNRAGPNFSSFILQRFSDSQVLRTATSPTMGLRLVRSVK